MKTVFTTKEEAIQNLYTDTEYQTKRYDELYAFFNKIIQSKKESYYFSASGRIEICGNHTDHQLGNVLTAAIESDAIAVAAKNDTNTIRVYSKFQKTFSIEIADTTPRSFERGKSAAIVRGIAEDFKKRNIPLCGIDMCITSDVATGSGISSSASFEILIATIIDFFCNDSKSTPYELATAGQFAEAVYFGKPCGLMDQSASAYGGCIKIDFNHSVPQITPTDISCVTGNYDLFIVHTDGNHSKLTNEYSSIVNEMSRAAGVFECNHLIEIPEADFLDSLNLVRNKAGDRAALRGLHFYAENKRVLKAEKALKDNNPNEFLNIINDSGDSSVLLLQNVYLDHVQNKSVALALALTKKFFAENNIKGACRIHGGGFMGTILVFIDKAYSERYKQYINIVFGNNAADSVKIRNKGGIAVCKTTQVQE